MTINVSVKLTENAALSALSFRSWTRSSWMRSREKKIIISPAAIAADVADPRRARDRDVQRPARARARSPRPDAWWWHSTWITCPGRSLRCGRPNSRAMPERERQARIVLAGFDGVDRLPRHAQPRRELALRPALRGSELAQPIGHVPSRSTIASTLARLSSFLDTYASVARAATPSSIGWTLATSVPHDGRDDPTVSGRHPGLARRRVPAGGRPARRPPAARRRCASSAGR